METIVEALWLPIVILFTCLITYRVGKNLRLNYRLSLTLYCWHSFFCLFYYYFSLTNIADASGYYRVALLGHYDWTPGTRFVESFTTVFVSGLGFGKLNTFLVFNVFGVISLLLLANVLLTFWPYLRGRKKYIPYLILLLPGISFWSSAIGKDSIAFFAACLATYAAIEIKNRKGLFFAAIIVMSLVRPHVGFFMLVAAFFALLMDKRIGVFVRFAAISFVVVLLVFSYGYVTKYVGIGEVSPEAIGDYVEKRQGYNLSGGGAVDMSSLPLPLKVFTYLFRPLFFDAPGVFGLAASVENLFLLSLFLGFFLRGMPGFLLNKNFSTRYNFVFFLVGLAAFSLITANLGISVRQKTMILPAMFFLIAFSAQRIYLIKNKKRTRIQVLQTCICLKNKEC